MTSNYWFVRDVMRHPISATIAVMWLIGMIGSGGMLLGLGLVALFGG